jgi:hypothetical protein
MSASHKPALHLSPLTGTVYIGRESKTEPGVLVGEKTDVTDTFTGIMLAKFGPDAPGSKNWEFTAAEVWDEESQTTKKPDTYRVTVERIAP